MNTENKYTNKMEKEYKTPSIGSKNIISFTCSDSALEVLIELFEHLNILGQMGSTREVTLEWDGDDSDRLEHIVVNGLSLGEWDKEWKRLRRIDKIYK